MKRWMAQQAAGGGGVATNLSFIREGRHARSRSDGTGALTFAPCSLQPSSLPTMISLVHFRRAIVAAAFIPAALRAQQPGSQFVGEWIGTLATPAAKLRLGLSVARDSSSGGLTGVMTSLDQGNAKIPATL